MVSAHLKSSCTATIANMSGRQAPPLISKIMTGKCEGRVKEQASFYIRLKTFRFSVFRKDCYEYIGEGNSQSIPQSLLSMWGFLYSQPDPSPSFAERQGLNRSRSRNWCVAGWV